MLPDAEALYFETNLMGNPARAGDPIPTYLVIKLWADKEGTMPLGMIGLHFPNAATQGEADQILKRARELESLIDDNVKVIKIQP